MIAQIATLTRLLRRLRSCAAAGVWMWSGFSFQIPAQATTRGAPLLDQSWTVTAENRNQSIFALLQTHQGYLWIGTNEGLVRFDGVRFTDFPFQTTEGMSKGAVVFTALWEDYTGGIWAGTEAGVTHYDGRQFSSLTRREGLPDNSILRIDGDETGAVWIYTREGVARWKDGTLRVVHPEADNTSPLIQSFPSDGDDLAHLGLWRHHGKVGLDRFAYGHWAEFPLPFRGARGESSQIRSVYEDSSHRVWYSLLSEPTTYHEVTAANKLVNYEGLPSQAFVFFRDRDGFLWLSDHQSHTARWKNGVLYPVPSLRTPYLTRVIQRPDGELWAGTYHTRLYLFKPQIFDTIKTPGAGEVGPQLFRRKDKTIWAASTDVVRFDGERAAPVAALGGSTAFGVATALGEDVRGVLLLGERWRPGVYELNGHTLIRSSRYAGVSGSVRAILLDSSGDEWFGTSTGLFRQRGGTTHSFQGLPPGAQVSCLLETSPSRIWVGTDKGVVAVSGEKTFPFPPESGWASWNVSSIAEDSDKSVWVGTIDQGLVHFSEGKFDTFDRRNGLPTDSIYGVDASDVDFIWLRTDVGLLRIRKRDLQNHLANQVPALDVAQFDEADNLPMSVMAPIGNQGVLHFGDGTTWFSTQGGIASMRVGAGATTRSATRAVIEEHSVDSSRLRPTLQEGIVMMPGEAALEIRYTALGSSQPEHLRFRYQLEGFDGAWVNAGDRRAAFYSHLPPGTFTFRVQATDGNQREWSLSEATILVTVRTPFYKTWWMKALLLMTMISAAALAIEVRRRHLLEIQRTRQAFTHRLIASQEAERKRIAHELHDGLGQHLALIRTLALLPAKLHATRPSQEQTADLAVDSLSTIADQAATAIREVESICYALRPYQLDRLGLTKAVRSLLRALAEGSPLLVRSSVDDIDGFFPHELEITFYRILQEAISNILKHSGATEVDVVVTREGIKLCLAIRDNGCGFSVPPDGAAASSLGLIGIAERAEALGGSAAIESSEGLGTRIVVEIERPATANSTTV